MKVKQTAIEFELWIAKLFKQTRGTKIKPQEGYTLE
jgi:hypothetical protein